jgi:hypothetical protein
VGLASNPNACSTIRVVFAAKLLKNEYSMHLVYLVYLVLKNLPVPVPAERRMAFNASRDVVEREDEEDEDEEDEEEDNYMEGLGL